MRFVRPDSVLHDDNVLHGSRAGGWIFAAFAGARVGVDAILDFGVVLEKNHDLLTSRAIRVLKHGFMDYMPLVKCLS